MCIQEHTSKVTSENFILTSRKRGYVMQYAFRGDNNYGNLNVSRL